MSMNFANPFHLNTILILTIVGSIVLMAFSLWAPWRPDAAKDVLPFATALVGFAGGLVTAMFKENEQVSSPIDTLKELVNIQQKEL